MKVRIGERLVELGLITEEHLDTALILHKSWGLRLGETLLALGALKPFALAEGLARHFGLGLADVSAANLDRELLRLLPEELMRLRRVLPVGRAGDRLSLAMVDPTDRRTVREVERLTGLQVTPLVATAWEVRRALEELFREQYLYEAIERHGRESPAESARRVLSPGQAVLLILLLLATFVWVALDWVSCLVFWNVLINFWYLPTVAAKLVLALRGAKRGFEHTISEEEVRGLADDELPLYTILLPVYKEPEVLPQLFSAIRNLDYPKGRLDVKILFEEDDRETLEAARALAPEPYFEFLVVPASRPKTKPKACNWGLLFARGEHVTIYDAEDMPDPDQLKKALLAFRKAHDPRVICVQAALSYYNPVQNLLTRWFSVEYSVWFRLFIPGLSSLNTIIPLGGTSNHFVTARLRELGAWDPFNVTEDADLGVRLAARGYRTTTVNSTTWEEANSRLRSWVRQRSRWVKGYMQTYLVHMRRPLRLVRHVGFTHFLLFQLNIGGLPLTSLTQPLTTGLLLVWILLEPPFVAAMFPGIVYPIAAFNLLVSNFLLVYITVVSLNYSGQYRLLSAALAVPLYFWLMSLGAYKALHELIARPFYWQKTQHGLATQTKGAAAR